MRCLYILVFRSPQRFVGRYAHTRNCPRLWAASARATETLSQGHGGSSAALVVQQEDAIRNAAGPFDTGVREYSEKELACSGSEATEGKSELSALIICFAALLMAGVRLICLAGRRRSVPLSQGAHPLQDAPPPHHQGSSRPPPVPKRMGSGPERIFTRPRAPSSGRSASDA